MDDKIKEKLAQLAKTKEQIIAQLNAVMGAEQVLTELLSNVQPQDNEQQEKLDE